MKYLPSRNPDSIWVQAAIRRIDKQCEDLRKMGFAVSTVDLDQYNVAVATVARRLKREVTEGAA